MRWEGADCISFVIRSEINLRILVEHSLEKTVGSNRLVSFGGLLCVPLHPRFANRLVADCADEEGLDGLWHHIEERFLNSVTPEGTDDHSSLVGECLDASFGVPWLRSNHYRGFPQP